MTTRGHGGYRQPARPAAVSSPRSGQRTDGGPGSTTQPVRVASGGPYGARQAAEAQQQGAPLPDNTGVPTAGRATPAPGGTPGAPPPIPELTAPTNRPNEPLTAGTVVPGEPVDTELMLRAVFDRFPSPWIGRLLRDL